MDITNFDNMQKLCIRFLHDKPRSVWRNHGIGMLQAYFIEGENPEVRMHIWHPDLIRSGLHNNGSVHDHRFDMKSTVLIGSLREKTYETFEDPNGDWESWSIVPARTAGKEKGFDGDCAPTGEIVRIKEAERIHLSKTTYTLPRGVFHESFSDNGLTITICSMYDKKGKARTLAPKGFPPVHAFGAPASDKVIDSVLREARYALTTYK